MPQTPSPQSSQPSSEQPSFQRELLPELDLEDPVADDDESILSRPFDMEDDLGLPEPEEPNEEDAGIKLRSGRIVSRSKVLIAEGLVERHQAHVVETYHAYRKAHEPD